MRLCRSSADVLPPPPQRQMLALAFSSLPSSTSSPFTRFSAFQPACHRCAVLSDLPMRGTSHGPFVPVFSKRFPASLADFSLSAASLSLDVVPLPICDSTRSSACRPWIPLHRPTAILGIHFRLFPTHARPLCLPSSTFDTHLPTSGSHFHLVDTKADDASNGPRHLAALSSLQRRDGGSSFAASGVVRRPRLSVRPH